VAKSSKKLAANGYMLLFLLAEKVTKKTSRPVLTKVTFKREIL